MGKIKNFYSVVVRILKEWMTDNVETSLPAIVIDNSTYEETQQLAVVQPLINKIYEDGQAIEVGYLYNVPVELPGTQESLISVPIKVGDTVTLKFSKRSLQELKDQAGVSAYTPKSRRSFHLNDAVAFPTVLNKPNNLSPHPDHLEIKHKDILVSYRDDGSVVVVTNDSTFTILPDGEMSGVNPNGYFRLAVSGDMDVNGCIIDSETGNVTTKAGTDLDAFKAAYDVHIHAHGTPNTGPPTPPPPE